jgi:hypothetical protein
LTRPTRALRGLQSSTAATEENAADGPHKKWMREMNHQAVIFEGDYARTAQYPDDAPFEIGQLEDKLTEVIAAQNVGEFDGNEIGVRGLTGFRLVMYGDSADALYYAIEKELRASPLTRGGKTILRYGPPGAPQQVVQF